MEFTLVQNGADSLKKTKEAIDKFEKNGMSLEEKYEMKGDFV